VPPGRRQLSEQLSKGISVVVHDESLMKSEQSLMPQTLISKHNEQLVETDMDSQSKLSKHDCGNVEIVSTEERVKRLRVDVLNSVLSAEFESPSSKKLSENGPVQTHCLVSEKSTDTDIFELVSSEIKKTTTESSKLLIKVDAVVTGNSDSCQELIDVSGAVTETETKNIASVNEKQLSQEYLCGLDCTEKSEELPACEDLSNVESVPLLEPEVMKEVIG